MINEESLMRQSRSYVNADMARIEQAITFADRGGGARPSERGARGGGEGYHLDAAASTIFRVTEHSREDEPPERRRGALTSAVNHPPHYTKGGIECIDAIEAATAKLSGFEGYCAGNALKYLWRHEFKNGNEDLQKAIWYIDRLAATRKKRGAK